MRAPALVLALLLATTVNAATYLVTTNDDSGPGSFRQGIVDANSGACASPCTIVFSTTQTFNVVRKITLASPLPPIRANGLTIAPNPQQTQFGNSRGEIHGENAGPG